MGLFNILFGKLIDKRIQKYQNNLINQQYAEIDNIYKTMRGWQHDYHNHIQTMKAYLSLNQLDQLDNYLNKLDVDLIAVDTVLKTGNIMVDAILNSKLSLARTRNINLNAKAKVPNKLLVSEIDLCIIIGNLFDNAMEACLKLHDEKKRFIRLYIDTFKEQLYISITNSSASDIKKNGRSYFTTKLNRHHGFGLMRIDSIANKYKGFVNRQNEEGVFCTEVMLPL